MCLECYIWYNFQILVLYRKWYMLNKMISYFIVGVFRQFILLNIYCGNGSWRTQDVVLETKYLQLFHFIKLKNAGCSKPYETQWDRSHDLAVWIGIHKVAYVVGYCLPVSFNEYCCPSVTRNWWFINRFF